MSASIGGIASKAAAANTATTTGVTTQASGSTFVIGTQADGASALGTPTDSKSNSYIPIDAETVYGGSERFRWWYCANGTGGAAHTATGTCTGGGFTNVYFIELVGVVASPLDQHSIGTDVTSPYTPPATGVTAQADEIALSFLAGFGGSNPSTHAESTGYTIPAALDQTNGASFVTGCVGWKSLTSTGTQQSSFTEVSNVGAAGIALATFKSAAAANALDEDAEWIQFIRPAEAIYC